MYLLDLWVSRDGFYMTPADIKVDWLPEIVRPYQTRWLAWSRLEEDWTTPTFEERHFVHMLLRSPDHETYRKYQEALRRGATVLLQGKWLQHYSWGEMSPDDWRRIDDELRLVKFGIY